MNNLYPEVEGKLLRQLIFVILLSVLIFMVNGLVPQFQMLLFDGNIPISITILKLLSFVFAAFVGAIFLHFRGDIKIHMGLFYTWSAFIGYLVLDIMLLNNKYLVKSFDLFDSINTIYLYILALPLFFIFEGSLEENKVVRLFKLISFPLLLIGLLQSLLNNPLFRVSSPKVDFKVFSWEFHGKTRAFSLFDSGYSFGHFIALFGAIIICLKMKRIVKILVLFVVLYAGYATLTRNTYLEIAAVLISTILMSVRGGRYFKRATPYLLALSYGLVGYLVNRFATTSSIVFEGNDLSDLSTLHSRTQAWKLVTDAWVNHDFGTIVFGTGLTQGHGFEYVDNMYLAVGAQFGLIGLIVFAALTITMANYLFTLARKAKSPLLIAAASFWTSFPLVGIYNISIPPYIFVFIIVMMTTQNMKSEIKPNQVDQGEYLSEKKPLYLA